MVRARNTRPHGPCIPHSLRMIERYRDLTQVFDQAELLMSGDDVRGYQLIRGVLAAHTTGGSFCVLCDARRPDLIENWYSVIRAVRSWVLRCRLQLMTWQELAGRAASVSPGIFGGKIWYLNTAARTVAPQIDVRCELVHCESRFRFSLLLSAIAPIFEPDPTQ